MAKKPKSSARHGRPDSPAQYSVQETRERLNRRLEVTVRSGDLQEAIALLEQLNELYPGEFAYLNLLGELCLKTRDFGRAVNAFSKALELDSRHVDVYVGLGLALHEFRHFEGAAASFEIALLWKPDHHRVMGYRALSLIELGRFDQALLLFDAAIQADPADPLHYLNRGKLLNRLGQHERALEDFSKAVSLKPNEAVYQLGHAAQWYRLRNHEAALAAIDCLIDAGKADVSALNFRGVLLSEMNRNEQALRAYDAALSVKADHADTQFNKALLLLTLGQFEQGLALYESRWLRSNAPALPAIPTPRWDGVAPLHESVLLVYAEQGLGDMIQFARYIPMVARLAAQVIFMVPRTLHGLLDWMPSNVTVMGEGRQVPQHDLHCPLMSLPLLMKTCLQTIPAQSFELSFPSDIRFSGVDSFLSRASLKVGICWSGNATHTNDHNRSLSFDVFRHALEDLDSFISIQKEVRASDQAAVAAEPRLLQVASQLTDLSVTAALIDQLDLVITVDTSVAHLAASLGKPTWILIAARPDFRWLLDRNDSPWYPTVTLFRQETPGDWSEALSRVRSRLAAVLAGGRIQERSNSPESCNTGRLSHA